MIKKISIIIFIVLCFGFGQWAISKYQAREARLKANQEALKQKAPQTKVTIIEGWNNKQIDDYLAKNQITKPGEFLKAAQNFDLSDYPNLTGLNKKDRLEGFIFPDTYFVPQTAPSGTTLSEVILKKALDNFSNKVTPKLISEGKNQGLSLPELVTLASIIERESNKDLAEKKIIAGLFYNRLRIGMALQSDATVNYVTGKGMAQATYDDIKVDSPYNTYKYAGLPPGPISNPGIDAVVAAAEPTKSDYLYFLSDSKTGKAIFAKTLDEHNANRVKYLK